ncbi:EMI domain-containing protein [Nonomuraea diastatica]|uniref:DUF2637 domain-containing protein n=1 Tax=Nonomuraea diastatica TaxID=1848329 RepID=A0A4R4WCW7_9ACTN|nr:EMI domain-containing protein [Nonomuraea diastatica]TDD15057.1 hypothetical protein E1294_35690 [Nonomuraea diastatica]
MVLLKADPEKEKRALEAEQLRIQRRRLASEARRADARAAEADRRERDETARSDRDRQRAESLKRWKARAQAAGRMTVMSLTNLGVTGVAVSGQAMSFMQRGLPPLWAVLAAGIVESVAVYVSWHAHVALREGDAAWTTRMWSYLIGAGAGYLSYTHVPDYPELFAACSLANPWLWSMHSRHLHRKDLRERGLIDPRAPKFSPMRWLLHLPETFSAFRWAVGEGEQSPAVAVQVVRQARRVDMTWRSVAQAQGAVIASQRSQLQLTLTRMAALAEEIRGLRPDAEKAMHDAAVFINSVGAGLVPRYRPPLGPAVAAEEPPTVPADQEPTPESAQTPRYRTSLRTRYREMVRTKNRTRKRTARRPAGSVPAPDRPDQKPADTLPVPGPRDRTKRTNKKPARSSTTGSADRVNELLPLGRTIAGRLKRNGEKLTRRKLQAALREAGQSASTKVATDLVGLLSGPGQPDQQTGHRGGATGPRDQPSDRTRTSDRNDERATATGGAA